MKILAPNWHKAISTWLLVAANVVSGAAAYLPEIQQALPSDWYVWAFRIILVARLIKQSASDAAIS